MPFDSIEAARADVVYSTNLGVFRSEQEHVQAVYARTTGAMQDEALKLAVAQERLNRAIAQQGPESYAAAKATVAYRATVDELARSETAAAAAAERAARQRLAAYAGAARTVGSTLTRFVTVPTALLTAAAVKMGVDFQQQMLLIQTQAGASAGEVHKLTGEVLQLAHFAPQGPVELAKGLYHLESLGLRGANAMHTLRISAIAAGMGIADLESTATALGAVVVTGIKGAENYDQAMGTLVGTVGAGNVRMEDLAGSIGNVAPAAAAAGISLTDLGAAIATLTDRGFSADEASTRLRIALALIQSPSDKARKSLADMGIDADSLGATLREPNGLLKVLEELHAGIERVGKTRGNRDLLAGFGGGRSGLGIQTLVQSLDSSVSSYRQKLDQVDAQSKRFAANQKTYLHSTAYQLHHDLASIEADLTSAGSKIAPVFVDIADGVTALAGAFGHLPQGLKTDLAVVVGILAVGGPLILGIAAVIRGVETIKRAFGGVPVAAGQAVAQTDAELTALQAKAAQVAAALEAAGAEGGAGLAAGIGAGVVKSEAELASLSAAEAGAGAGGLLGGLRGGVGGLLGGLRGGIGRAGAYGIGGLVAGQIIEGVIPGQAGKSLGSATEYAGLGAALGSFVGPEGTLIGAGLGAIVGGIASLVSEGPSVKTFTQQLDDLHKAASGVARTKFDVHLQIANDRVSRDQLEQELRAARADEIATRGTRRHAAAVDRLRQLELQLVGVNKQLGKETDKLAQAEKRHEAILNELAQKRAEAAAGLDNLRTAIEATVHTQDVQIAGLTGAALKAREAKDSTKRYTDQLAQMAKTLQSSDPKLADVALRLIRIAQRVHHIPSEKTVHIVIDQEYRTSGKPAKSWWDALGFDKLLKTANGGDSKTGRTHYVAPFTTTIPIKLQISLQRAENAGDVAAQRHVLQEEKAFLERELKKAHTRKQELEALQAIGYVDGLLSSLTSTSTHKIKTREKNRRAAHLAHVEAEQRKLEINLARARLAEEKAGQNKAALERARRAERRALQDEINVYRQEAHDQALALKERQRYAKLAVAAESAKLKLGNETARQTKAIKQAEAQVLNDLQTILQNFAPNVFSTNTKPVHHHHVKVDQWFPAAPTDQHRQARLAYMAMRSAFDG